MDVEQMLKRRKSLVRAVSIINNMSNNYAKKEDGLHIKLPNINCTVTLFLLVLLAVLYIYSVVI